MLQNQRLTELPATLADPVAQQIFEDTIVTLAFNTVTNTVGLATRYTETHHVSFFSDPALSESHLRRRLIFAVGSKVYAAIARHFNFLNPEYRDVPKPADESVNDKQDRVAANATRAAARRALLRALLVVATIGTVFKHGGFICFVVCVGVFIASRDVVLIYSRCLFFIMRRGARTDQPPAPRASCCRAWQGYRYLKGV